MKNDTQMEPHFRKAVAEIDQDIAVLDADRARLLITRNTLVELYGGETELAPPKKAERKPRATKMPTPTPGTPAAAVGDDEPESLGAAMKKIIRELKTFTSDELRERVKARYLKLFEEVGPSAFGGNLKYWTGTGKLNLAGDKYTITATF